VGRQLKAEAVFKVSQRWYHSHATQFQLWRHYVQIEGFEMNLFELTKGIESNDQKGLTKNGEEESQRNSHQSIIGQQSDSHEQRKVRE